MCRLVVIPLLAVLAPPRLVLALDAVLRSVRLLVFHLENVVELLRSRLSGASHGLACLNNLRLAEVVDVRVLLVQFCLHLLNALLDGFFRLTRLFLQKAERITC